MKAKSTVHGARAAAEQVEAAKTAANSRSTQASKQASAHAANVRCNMANSEIIGAGQDTARRAPKSNTITCGDCLEVMQAIPDKSVDMILCDLPYGTTQNKWDSVINLSQMWNEYKRVCNGSILLFGVEPFSSKLRMSNLTDFKYDWIWCKTQSRGHLNAYKRPMVKHEIVSVFIGVNYSPILSDKPLKDIRPHSKSGATSSYGAYNQDQSKNRKVPIDKKLPESVLVFSNAQNTVHPTQKPVALFEYLIRTYTNEGDTVLDNCIGSGTTAIACINTNRNFIGIEKEEKYCRIAEERIHALRSPAQNAMEICHTAPNT